MAKRDATLKTMYSAALKITGKNADRWTRAKEDAIWSMCSDFNSANPDEEILMCEHADDAGNVDGFYIEDDYFLTQN